MSSNINNFHKLLTFEVIQILVHIESINTYCDLKTRKSTRTKRIHFPNQNYRISYEI